MTYKGHTCVIHCHQYCTTHRVYERKTPLIQNSKLSLSQKRKMSSKKIPLLLFLLVTLLANCLTVCAILWAVLSGSNDFARTLNPFQGQVPVCPTLCFALTKVWIEIRYLWNWAELARDSVGKKIHSDSLWSWFEAYLQCDVSYPGLLI